MELVFDLPPASEEAEVIQAKGKKGKRTYQPNVRARARHPLAPEMQKTLIP